MGTLSMKTFNTDQEAKEYSVINPLETVEYKEYYDDGQPRYHCFFVNSKANGEFKSYHENGQLSIYRFYVNGTANGECKSYHDNGKLEVHYFFVNGEEINLDHLKDGSYKSLCIKHTLFDGNVINEDI